MSEHKYNISILLPTRGRTVTLSRSVMSLFNRCLKRDRVQLILGFDEDDAEAIAHFQESLQPWLDSKGVNYEAMLFPPLGHGRINEYVNSMAASADADWLFVWHDDALMETTSWEKIIDGHTGEFKLLSVYSDRKHPYSMFPIVPRTWFEQTGHVSVHQKIEAEISQVAYMLDVFERVEIYVTHDTNQTDATKQAQVKKDDFNSPEMISARVRDAEILSVYMKSLGLNTTAWEQVKANSRDPWVKLRTNDEYNQVTDLVQNGPTRPSATDEPTHSIGVLIPTRKRPQKLFDTVKSFVTKADKPKDLQIMIGVDTDDQETIDFIQSDIGPYLDKEGVKFMSLHFPRQGYSGLNVYYNELASWCSTRWLMMFSDDATMETPGFDTMIESYGDKFCCLAFDTHNHHPYSIFPTIPTKWFHVIGALSDHSMGDAVISHMSYWLDIMIRTPIKVFHDRPDLTGTAGDITHQERVLHEGNPKDPRDLNHVNHINWRYAQAEKLAGYLRSIGQDTTWWENVKSGKQDPWVKLRENDPNKMTTF